MFDLTENSGLYAVKISDTEILYLKAPTRNIEVRILDMYNKNYDGMSFEEQEEFLHGLGKDILIGRFDHIENKEKRGIFGIFSKKKTVIDESFIISMQIEKLAALIMDYMESFYKFNKKK